MGLKRRAAKRDANERPIIDAMVKAGATVWQVSEKGLPDLVVGYQRKTYLLEVKAPGRGLTEDQEKAHAAWRGGTIHVIETPEQALQAIGAVAPEPAFVPPPLDKRRTPAGERPPPGDHVTLSGQVVSERELDEKVPPPRRR